MISRELKIAGKAALIVSAVTACWGNLAFVQASSAAPATASDSPGQEVTVLNGKDTLYRWMCLTRPAVLVGEPGSEERTALTGRKIDARQADTLGGKVPAKWTDAEFDHSRWPRNAAAGDCDGTSAPSIDGAPVADAPVRRRVADRVRLDPAAFRTFLLRKSG